MKKSKLLIALAVSYLLAGCVSNPSATGSDTSKNPPFPEDSLIMKANFMAQDDWVATRKSPWPANGTKAGYRVEVGYKKFKVTHGTPFRANLTPYYHKAFKDICESRGGKYMQRPVTNIRTMSNCFKANDYYTVYFAVDINEEELTIVRGVWAQEIIVTEPTGDLKSDPYLKAVHPNRRGPTEGY